MDRTRDPQALGGPERAERLMGLMERNLGFAPGHRRAHGRGVLLQGHFRATPEVAALTTAEHLQGSRIEVVARLSNGTGSPHSPDHAPVLRGSVLGLGVRFALPSGGHSAWAALNIESFPARVPDDFLGLTDARRQGLPTGLPNPARFLAFLATHRHLWDGIARIVLARTTVSFAHSAFHGLHAYWAVDAAGRRQAFRYHWLPAAGERRLSLATARGLPRQYLTDELVRRVTAGPVEWDLVLELAEPGDPTDDLTRRWPATRRRVTAGRLVLDRLHEDPAAADDLVFDPVAVPPGIECSDDPVLHFRSAAYTASHRRRSAERAGNG